MVDKSVLFYRIAVRIVLVIRRKQTKYIYYESVIVRDVTRFSSAGLLNYYCTEEDVCC